MDALAPEWMKSKEMPSSQGKSMLGRERGPPPKYGKQHSYHHFTYLPSSSSNDPSAERKPPSTPFSCSVASSPSPSSPNGEVNPRVLNRSKSSPGFGSPKSAKPKLKSPDRSSGFNERSFPSFGSHPKPPLKPKPVKPSFFPSYGKSQSQPNLFNTEKTAHWHQQKFQNSPMQPPSSSPSHLSHLPHTPSHLSHSSSHSSSHLPHAPPVVTTSPPPPSVTSQPQMTVTPPHVSPSPSPPLPPSSSPPPTTAVPDELDKLRQLVPSAVMPPKSVRPRALVGPPPPLTKKTREASNTISSPSPSSPLVSLASSSSVTQQQPPGSSSPVAGPPGQPMNLASYFRKATSEPTLMHHKAQMDARRAKALEEKEKEKAQRELLRETANGPKQKRSNFFQHVIKQEGQPKTVEDDSPIGQDQQHPGSPAPESDSDPSPSSTTSTTPLPSSPPPALLSPPLGMRSPLPEDVEDEERFLRTMGWVPESEERVPVLEEEEMADVRVKIFLSKKKEGEEEDEVEEERRGPRLAPLSPPVGVGVE